MSLGIEARAVREVTLDGTGPLRLDEDDIDEEYGDIAVCRCGLSEEFPLCDGSHRRTDGEAAGVRYKYVDGERRRVEEIRLVAAEDDTE
ncbi:CDGSH iron-sulfur domain-containing protein [Halobaculum gomorrense]|uniref:Iron-binding zinc finger CDGSH type n=1 Tax=Halobaculum gomorrense TaxID=43928 RepID=A0A1M5N0L0_9EURY|nr:CDGSH iron-sulfur domain-containing protein [Halobaculum gomorrense]SHG83071.1 Iron-binding zinc finger CDGSH type [Halobaculum gomorrense]